MRVLHDDDALSLILVIHILYFVSLLVSYKSDDEELLVHTAIQHIVSYFCQTRKLKFFTFDLCILVDSGSVYTLQLSALF